MTSAAGEFSTYADAVADRTAMPELFLVDGTGTHLDPYQALRKVTPAADLRRRGAFFTGTDVAAALWRDALSTVSSGSIVVDPACGAGDLLLPVAAYAAGMGLEHLTLRCCDVDADFVQIAGARLRQALSADAGQVQAHARDFLTTPSSVADATHVVLNPPFVAMRVATPWGNGTVNAAAVFVMSALAAMSRGARLVAVLPDVLRSGTRYEQWRAHLQNLGRVASIQVLGQFDADTDVHVFILEVEAGESGPAPSWVSSPPSPHTVGDRFDIRVGTVVPHRHAEVGDEVEFVTARSLTSGRALTRRFSGRLDVGPLVLINRTSRPGETPRARARLRLDPTPAAIENHLLVAVPRTGGVVECRALMDVLADTRTADFLDDRIRCRHLTASAVKEIPWLS